MAEQHELALEDLRGVCDLDLQRVGDVRDVAAVEVAAVQHVTGGLVDQRVITRAVELDLDGGSGLVEHLEQHPDDVR